MFQFLRALSSGPRRSRSATLRGRQAASRWAGLPPAGRQLKVAVRIFVKKSSDFVQKVPHNFYPVMYYIYVIKSKIKNWIYIGFTSDLRKRFQEHNLGKVRVTKGNRPFILAYYEAYRNEFDAKKRKLN